MEDIIAIDKFICEAVNFETVLFNYQNGEHRMVPRFIVEAQWSCPTEHMVGKWVDCQKDTDCYGEFVKFYCSLDNENKKAMSTWILDNREKGWIYD